MSETPQEFWGANFAALPTCSITQSNLFHSPRAKPKRSFAVQHVHAWWRKTTNRSQLPFALRGARSFRISSEHRTDCSDTMAAKTLRAGQLCKGCNLFRECASHIIVTEPEALQGRHAPYMHWNDACQEDCACVCLGMLCVNLLVF